jgi:hypothetical protein
MGNSQQVAPPGEKPARRWVIPPALRGEYLPFLSFVNRPVRTRMRGVVGAGEGDLPGYPISPFRRSRWVTPPFLNLS